MRALAILTTLVAATAMAQIGEQKEFKPKATKTVKASDQPVTRAEAAKTFEKAWKALGRGLKIQGAAPYKIAADNKPVTKDEVLGAVLAITNAAKPHFKRIPVSAKYDAKKFRTTFSQPKFLPLVKLGFVMPYGPLVTGKTTTVTPYEFGDAVGVMLIRIADLAHLPSRKFSPALMDAGG
jgi:hypothetical protein